MYQYKFNIYILQHWLNGESRSDVSELIRHALFQFTVKSVEILQKLDFVLSYMPNNCKIVPLSMTEITLTEKFNGFLIVNKR